MRPAGIAARCVQLVCPERLGEEVPELDLIPTRATMVNARVSPLSDHARTLAALGGACADSCSTAACWTRVRPTPPYGETSDGETLMDYNSVLADELGQRGGGRSDLLTPDRSLVRGLRVGVYHCYL